MQVVNKKMCVIVILVLVIIESCTLFLMYKSYGNKNTNLDEVNLNINNANMFAIMLEQDDGTYKEDTTSTWPTSGYTYNASMSGCIDINGNRIEDALTYDKENNKASVNTTNTSYCYLYFSIKNMIGDYILKNPTSGLNNITLEAGMYRYQGIDNVDNYICFGTSVKSECVGNTDAFMYRIIGITPDNKLKLIKKEALNSTVKWYGNKTTNITWPNSLIYTTLNENDYLLNETYVPTGWGDKIITMDWKYGDTIDGMSYNGSTMYSIENPFGESISTSAWTNIVSAKIGLMYIHDYYYSYALGGAPGSSSNAKTAWIHLSKNDTSSYPDEWTMSRAGYMSDYYAYSAWSVTSEGGVNWGYLNVEYSVRPVFYLTSDVEIIGGTGTIDDPFIIK